MNSWHLVSFTDVMGPREWLVLFRDRLEKHGDRALFSAREVAHIVAAASIIPVSAWPESNAHPEGA